MTDEAKAIGEVAKASGPIVEAASGLVRYFGGIMGTLPHDLLGIAGADWLSQARRRNLGRMEARTAKLLESVDPARVSPPSPSVGLPLLNAALSESREELQKLWAALLAASMTDGGNRVRQVHIETLAKLEVLDAIILDRCFDKLDAAGALDGPGYQNLPMAIAQEDELDVISVSLSVQHLGALKLFNEGSRTMPLLTTLARSLVLVCRPAAIE